ncbi:DivIVA domain-containing protein [Occultella glacieicola]|uniref:Cell wall synthesis protein Wag31 n=1 Tax=Occultella glacieicola TaxID=2518684 RepID=A0ABY2E5S6_9MICO|nr:DivIVA domain-containing protein [Occultella glacieicola]
MWWRLSPPLPVSPTPLGKARGRPSTLAPAPAALPGSTDPSEDALITADQVLNARFQTTRFRPGYDQDEVDDFLDEIVAGLRQAETGQRGTGTLRPDEVAAKRFSTTSFRQGYDQAGVDALLREVRATLETHRTR